MHFGGAHRTSLREIMIPHVLKTIKESVFENCSGLTTVTLMWCFALTLKSWWPESPCVTGGIMGFMQDP
jgi:hypothetical protein